ncbi:MAG TPA: ATP-binding protein [Candidatus Limnocylindrales bacterium]|nr:ATP-binding protein [Candidatus Limnocylindrales bacterium]
MSDANTLPDDAPEEALTIHERLLAELKRKLATHMMATETIRLSLEENQQIITLLNQSIAEQEAALETKHEADLRRTEEMEKLRRQLHDQDKGASYKLALALTLANISYDALVVVDDQFRVIAINDAAESLFEADHPIGKLLDDVTGQPELGAMAADAVAYGEEVFEDQLTREKRRFRVRVRLIHRASHFFIGIALQDVTELVRLNRARRDMVANISHELRTPIANIRLIIEGLFHEDEKPKRKQSTTALRAIAHETDSLLWLLQELLDLSMIESGQAILRMIDVPLKPLVDEAVGRLEDQIDAKNLTVIREVPEDLYGLADQDQVRRVLVNLIHNAIKWSPEGKTLRVTAEPAGDEVVLSVIDEGPGVSDEHTERIFERFYQVDPSRSAGEGTGLGLAICRHIVEAHGGRIWAEGNLEGTRGGIFRFTLAGAEEGAPEAAE